MLLLLQSDGNSQEDIVIRIHQKLSFSQIVTNFHSLILQFRKNKKMMRIASRNTVIPTKIFMNFRVNGYTPVLVFRFYSKYTQGTDILTFSP